MGKLGLAQRVALGHLPRMPWAFVVRYRVLLLLLAAGACGGQSGNEGDAPAFPCAYDQPLVVGRIDTIEDRAVRVRVDRVVRGDDSVIVDDAGSLFAVLTDGAVLQGTLDETYAWRHDFVPGASVAAVLWPRDGEVSLQLFPFEDDRVQVQYGRQDAAFELEDLIAPDCQSRLDRVLDPPDDTIEDGC